MIENYIPRKLLEKEKYYRFEGEYFLSILEESPLCLYDLIKKGNNKIILLGDAGYGKSTELRNLFSKFVEEENPDFIPIFIDLSTYSDEDIKEYIKHKIGEDSLDLLNIDTSKLVFLFDEFDQVPDKGKAERKIKNFIEKYKMSTFVITSRTNFYSGQFEGFDVYVLLPLSSNDIQEYARILLENLYDSFIGELRQKSIFDLAKNPFFLQRIIEIYQTDKIIPSSRASVFDRIISLVLEQDVVKLRNKYDLKRTYPVSEIEKDLMYLALIMETLQRNFISVEEFNQVINDDKKSEVISELNLIKKSFFKEGDVYQFQHNNFQEYLSAKILANEDFNIVSNFISVVYEKRLPLLDRFMALLKYIEIKPSGIKIEEVISAIFNRAKYKRIDKINPSWVNTVSFLSQLRQEGDLFEYLMENEPELCLKFEVNRIDERKREKIFETIFEKYTKRKIWLDRERIDYEEMAHFAKTKETYNYLMDFARSKEHFVYRHNAILLLGMMKELADNALHNLLIQYAIDESENSNVRDECLYALAQLGETDMETIDKLIHLKDSSDEKVLSGFYYLIKESTNIDIYVDILLDGIHKTREFTLVDVRRNLKQGIENVTSANGLRTIIKYFIENPEVLRDYVIEISIEEIIKNTIKVYKKDNALYDEIKELTIIVDKKYITKVIPCIIRFFHDTGTAFRLFEELYEEGLESHYSFLAPIADEQCINFLIEKYQKGKITENNIQIFINFLVRGNKDFDSLLKMITQKTGKFQLPPPRDYLKEQKEELQRKVQIIFDKNEFLKKVEKIFNNECKKELSYEELNNISMYRWKEQEKEKYNDFVINELREYFINKRQTLDSLKEEINKWDYGLFTIAHIFNLLYHGTNVELSKEQIALIKEYCLKNLQRVNFKNAIKQEDKTTTANTLATILWYFLRKFEFDYPKGILLDMLSFDWSEEGKYIGINYLIERLPQADVKSRIIKNLKEGISVNQVLKNHISYCKKYHVLEAKELIQKIIENKNIETEDRLLALETIITLNDSIEFLEKLLNTDEQKIFIEVAKILLSRGNKKCRKKLLENLSFEKGKLALDSARLLIIEKQNIKAIKFYADFIKRTKEFEAVSRGESLLSLISTTKALPIIFKLLKFSYEYKGDIKQDEFFTLSHAVFGVLRKIALQSFSNFKKVLRNLHKFIRKYDSKFEGINFLHFICDNIEKAFFANHHSHLTFDNAKRKVDDFLMARVHDDK